MKKLDIASAVLLFIGAVTWGFIGIFDVNIIHFFVENQWGDRFIYTLVGLAAVYRAVYYRSIHKRWKE